VTLNVKNAFANWWIASLFALPCTMMLFYQVPLMVHGSADARTNVELAGGFELLAAIIAAWRYRITIDPTAKRVTWRRLLFGFTWHTRVVPADRFTALVKIIDRGSHYVCSVWLDDKEGKRWPVRDVALKDRMFDLEECATVLEWSIKQIDLRR
jgi:hypothetical protein